MPCALMLHNLANTHSRACHCSVRFMTHRVKCVCVCMCVCVFLLMAQHFPLPETAGHGISQLSCSAPSSPGRVIVLSLEAIGSVCVRESVFVCVCVCVCLLSCATL